MPTSLCASTVIITKPQEQSAYLSGKIHALGAHIIALPTLIIAPLEEANVALNQITLELPHTDFIIFISPNAVTYGLPTLHAQLSQWPSQLQWLTVGLATAKKLHDYNIKNILIPTKHYTSEGLLDLPELQSVSGKRVVIISGKDGRTYLQDTLQARGANVHRVACYQRLLSSNPIDKQLNLWQQANNVIVMATSAESLENLSRLVQPPYDTLWQQARLLLSSTRLANTAHELGYQGEIMIAKSAMDDDMINAFKQAIAHPG